MELKRIDFNYTSDKRGYMVTYKGHKIGGASIIGTGSNIRGRAASKQAKDNSEQAEKTIQLLINGGGHPTHKSALKAIIRDET